MIGQHLRAAKLATVSLRYRRDEVVYERGAPAQFIYAVTEGTLCRLRVLEDGRRLILQFLFPGDVFGYEQGRNHRDTVQALTKDARALSAGREALLEASKSDARLSHFLFTAAARAEAVVHWVRLWIKRAAKTFSPPKFLWNRRAPKTAATSKSWDRQYDRGAPIAGPI